MEKEFGKLSLEQIKQLLSQFPELRDIRTEVIEYFRDSGQNLLEKSPVNFSWANHYETPLQKITSDVSRYSGSLHILFKALEQDDPQQYFLDNYLKDETRNHDLANGEELDVYLLFTSWYALMKSIESIEIYGCSMSRLIEQAKAGDEKSLFNAIRIDRSVATCEFAKRRISIAQVQEDETFFKKLRNALEHPPKKQYQAYDDIRYLLAALGEFGELDKLKPKQLHKLFHTELGLYRDDLSSFRKFLSDWKKKNATSNLNFESSI